VINVRRITDEDFGILMNERGTLITLTFAVCRRLRCFITWVNIQMKWKKTWDFILKC